MVSNPPSNLSRFWVLALFDEHQLAFDLEVSHLVNDQQEFRAPSCQINQHLWP